MYWNRANEEATIKTTKKKKYLKDIKQIYQIVRMSLYLNII